MQIAQKEGQDYDITKPWRLKRAVSIAAYCGLLSLSTACDEPGPASITSPVLRAQTSVPLVAVADQFGRSSLGIDATFRKLEDSVPGFGGYFLNDAGVLIAYLKDPSYTEALTAKLRSRIAAHEERVHNPLENVTEIEIRSGKFSYSQLSDWQSELSRSFGHIAALAAIDADEAQNKVAITVIAPEAEAAVIAQANALGIPLDALTFRVGESFDSRSATLQNLFTTTAGGIQITEGTGWCTLGFNDGTGIDRYAITAAHCINDALNTTGQTGSAFYQNTTSGNYAFDVDINVPWNYSSPSCGGYTLCTTSDAMRLMYLMTFSALRLKVTATGSITVTGEDTVTSVTTPIVGLSVTRIGRTSGSNTTNVAATCENRVSSGTVGNTMNLCVDRAGGSTSGGDSGGPVAVRLGSSRASMVGLILTNAVGGGYTLTNYTQIVATIGSINPY